MRSAPPKKLVIGVLVAALVALALPHLSVAAFGRYANVDEAYAIAIGERLNEGYKLYEGAVSQRGPLMYHAFALIARIGGWDNVAPIRVVALGVAVFHVGLVFWMGERRLARGAGAIAAVIVTYTIGFGLPAWDGLALNGETLLVPLALGGAIVGAFAIERRRSWLFLLAGAMFGAAIAIKPSASLHPVPVAVWIAALAACHKRPLARSGAELTMLALGVLFVPVVFVLQAWRSGTLGAMYYYCVTYNLTAHRSASPEPFGFRQLYSHVVDHTAFFGLLALAIMANAAYVVRRLRAVWRLRSLAALVRAFGFRRYIGAHALVATAMAAALPQHFGHYYVPAVGALALSAAHPLARLLAKGPFVRAARWTLGIGAGFVLGCCAIFAGMTLSWGGHVGHEPMPERVAEYIQRTTPVDDRIFVWGFSPWIYGYSARRPAGRFVFGTYLTGWAPLFWDAIGSEPTRVAPGSMSQLISDLERERPDLVIDAGSVFIARPMNAYPEISRWVRANYCFEARIGAIDLYRKNKAGAACQTPYFPCPHPPIDAFGRPLFFVTMPPVVDKDGVRLLPGRDSDAPRAFGGTTPAECPE